MQGQSENKSNASIAKEPFGSVRKFSCKLCHNYFLDTDNADDADSVIIHLRYPRHPRLKNQIG